ncbi:MAG: hypothetical protein R3E98_15820 [Gemmatimonadota bacterium]
MLKTLLLALALSPQEAPAPWIRADSVVILPERPRLLLVERPGDPRVALRWFVPLQETAERAGAGQVLALLAQRRAEAHAERLGAHFSVRRTHQGIAYAVSGSGLDVDHLFEVLRIAVSPPETDPVLVRRATSTVLAALDRDLESAERNLAARLAQPTCPGTPPLAGTRESLTSLRAPDLAALWRSTHADPESTTLVVAGDLPLEVVLASLPELGAGQATGSGRTYAAEPAPERPGRTQVLRQWYGEARPAGPADDPRAEVAARLVGRAVGSVDAGLQLTLELVDSGCSSTLVLVGGAYRQDAARLRRTVQELVRTTRDGLSEAAVQEAVLEIQRAWVRRSATAEGVAELVGAFAEGGGDPTAAARYADALAGLDRSALVAFFDRLLAAPPVRAELGS